jgi:ferritin-like metal-binding protein YciE
LSRWNSRRARSDVHIQLSLKRVSRSSGARRALDAAIVGSAQAVEHYEIARYGTLIAWADELGRDDAVRLLTTNLNEEKAADKKLSTVALRKGVNRKAAS